MIHQAASPAPWWSGGGFATLSIFRVPPRHRIFALARVSRARWELADVPGATSGAVRLLGTGAGDRGLSPRPGVDRWGVLVPGWRDLAAARAFLDESRWMRAYRSRAREAMDLFLVPVGGHGRWDGATPFGREGAAAAGDRARPRIRPPQVDDPRVADAPLAVLTRATVRARSLPGFFRAAAEIEGDLTRCGALFALGLGELPWVRQATFSVWPNLDAMRRFAYEARAHRDAMKEARKHGWFTEDLFVRFRVMAARGTWNGVDPFAAWDLAGLPDPPGDG